MSQRTNTYYVDYNFKIYKIISQLSSTIWPYRSFALFIANLQLFSENSNPDCIYRKKIDVPAIEL